MELPGRVAHPITCLTEESCLAADPRVMSSIPARSHTFVEFDHEIFYTANLLPSPDSRKVVVRVVVSYEVLANRLVKLAQVKSLVR